MTSAQASVALKYNDWKLECAFANTDTTDLTMSSADVEEDAVDRRHVRPYGEKRQIPTIQGYRQHRKEIEERYGDAAGDDHVDGEGESRTNRAYQSAKTILKGEDDRQDADNRNELYPASNYNDLGRPRRQYEQANHGQPSHGHGDDHVGSKGSEQEKEQGISRTEQAVGAIDPKDKRKAMKKAKHTAGRQVTDPVTHLPIEIHDQTEHHLKALQENFAIPGSDHRTATGVEGASKDQDELDAETEELQRSYHGMQKTFPPPRYKDVGRELSFLYQRAITVAVCGISSIAALIVCTTRMVHSGASWPQLALGVVLTVLLVASAAGLVVGVRGWTGKKVSGVWEDEVWESQRREENRLINDDSELPESVQWLNSVLRNVWPLINPDLFAALVDTLEDVMQASLPKVVRMVSVDDAGQGSEAPRILGVRWLPTGAASQSVDEQGRLRAPDKASQTDRVAAGEGEEDHSTEDQCPTGEDFRNLPQNEQAKKQKEQEQQSMRAGMEAEEGDFVNLEVALAYRTRSTGRSIASKAKNAHLYLKFYFPGNIVMPVWVELRGFVGIMRFRLQLTPDPPFFSLCTLTLLGQPKVDLSCIPISKHSLNVMDVPLISSFVQSAVDAALAEYVAPKSLTLDLKDMLVGEDFKKNTIARGVVWICIKSARGFKEGDGGIGPIKGSSDAYVTVSWDKFGKPVASTRVIEQDQEPNWEEYANILVSVEEINADEKLRLQLWDSDKWTADDDLGRVELDLRELMHSERTKNRMCDREDRFTAQNEDEVMPGTLTWSVGYFEKTRITQGQLEQQTVSQHIRTKDQLKSEARRIAERKLREAQRHGHDEELHQQQVQDYKTLEDDMIISAPPDRDRPCGILGIQIHNITGLEIASAQRRELSDQKVDREDEDEKETNLPDSYCTIILNHRKIYKTRTKPQNSKPFFNAATERFIKDWTSAEIIVSVRDSRETENDALLGVVYLPLDKVFSKRSQVMANYPLAGGVGYGRARISMVWRSVELKLPPNLTGWDYGTLEIKGAVKSHGQLPHDLTQHRIKLRSSLSKIRMYPQDGEWQSRSKKHRDSQFLAVRKRYGAVLSVEFRKSTIGFDKTPAFAVLWLQNLTDEQEETFTIKVWKGSKDAVKRATSSCNYHGYEKGEQPLGEIELSLKFWRGLSGYHHSHAQQSNNGDVRDVMECLDIIHDEKMDEYSDDESMQDSSEDTETESQYSQRGSPASHRHFKQRDGQDGETRRRLRTHTNDQSDSEGSDTQSTESGSLAKVKAPVTAVKAAASKLLDQIEGDHDPANDSSRGVRGQIADYRDHRKQLHRKHRGIMQWKSIRTLDWMGGKAKRAKSRVGELFEHTEKDQGIETEV